MERLRQQPGIGPLVQLVESWPRITAWIVLSVGCVVLLAYEARDVGLSTGNWIALIVATVGVAGLCILIVSWEDEDEVEDTAAAVASPPATEPAPAASAPQAEAAAASEAGPDDSGADDPDA